MSKSVWIKILLLAVFCVAHSCKKEASVPTPEGEAQTVHYRAAIETGVVTKATIGEDLKYQFEEGDRVYLESEDGNLYGLLSMVSDGGVGKKTAYFEGDLQYVGEDPLDNPAVNLTLLSKQDELHSFKDGKLSAVTSASYASNKWASSLEEAISHLSHFIGSGNFNDKTFTLHQQSGFLKCFVRMKKAEAPVDSDFTVKLFNSDSEEPFRQASITVTTAGEIPFVFAYLGDEVTLENAKLVVEQDNTQVAGFYDIKDMDLAGNKFYSISRSTLSFDGFKIKAVYNTTITFNYNNEDSGIEYSLDYGESGWIPYTKPFTLKADEVACIRGERENYKNVKNGDAWWTPADKPIFTSTALCYISGNIMSLLKDKVNISESAFQGAFSRGGTELKNIDIDPLDPLILPATKLAWGCYMRMFHNCTSLTSAPSFTVEETAEKCCYNMFRKCSNLVNVGSIQLPAKTLSPDCYRELFRECSKLTTAPVLPAPTLVQECYRQMFSSSGIKSIVCLATDISAMDCLNEWVSGVPSSGTFYTAPGMTNAFPSGSHGIPSGWEVEEYTGN